MHNSMPRFVALLGLGLALTACVVARPVAGPPIRAPEPLPAPAPMYFYPERGQEAALQERDRYECYRWAVGQSGFDPGMTPVTLPRRARAPIPRGARTTCGRRLPAWKDGLYGSIGSPPGKRPVSGRRNRTSP